MDAMTPGLCTLEGQLDTLEGRFETYAPVVGVPSIRMQKPPHESTVTKKAVRAIRSFLSLGAA